MTGAAQPTVSTVLGAVPASDLGVVAIHEALLSVVPGAQYAYDIEFDDSRTFATLAAKLVAFRDAGGGTVVDSTGMFHGRDVPLYEALSRTTGVHIIASTGMGPEEMLGGYFLTPQTNPPTPWPADKFADLFTREVTEGMVVERRERRAPAGLVVTAATLEGMTATDESLFRGAARTGLATGVPVSIRFGADAVHDLDIVLDEGLPADRVVVGDLDRADAVAGGAPLAVAERGAYVGIDHVGTNDDGTLVTDQVRADLVRQLIDAGHVGRILLSCNAIGVAKGQPDRDPPYGWVLTDFTPLLAAQGIAEDDVHRVLVDNPRDLLIGK